MKLTKKKAIEISIELWTWLAETGEEKEAWDSWGKYGGMAAECALCEYVNQQIGESGEDEEGDVSCLRLCPYAQKFEHCCGEGEEDTIYIKWDLAPTPESKKEYAKLFLEQLKEL